MASSAVADWAADLDLLHESLNNATNRSMESLSSSLPLHQRTDSTSSCATLDECPPTIANPEAGGDTENDPIIAKMLSQRATMTDVDIDAEEERQRRMYVMLRWSQKYKKMQVEDANERWKTEAGDVTYEQLNDNNNRTLSNSSTHSDDEIEGSPKSSDLQHEQNFVQPTVSVSLDLTRLLDQADLVEAKSQPRSIASTPESNTPQLHHSRRASRGDAPSRSSLSVASISSPSSDTPRGRHVRRVSFSEKVVTILNGEMTNKDTTNSHTTHHHCDQIKEALGNEESMEEKPSELEQEFQSASEPDITADETTPRASKAPSSQPSFFSSQATPKESRSRSNSISSMLRQIRLKLLRNQGSSTAVPSSSPTSC